jgi:hypothetical protein
VGKGGVWDGPAQPEGGESGLIEDAEQGIDEAQIVTDPELLAGSGFQLTGSLCPDSQWEGQWPFPGGDKFDIASLATFYVRATDAGGLELVTSTGVTGGGLTGDRRVQITPLLRSSRGFSAERVFTCARLGHVDADYGFRTDRYESNHIQLVFWQEAPDAALRARLVAAGEGPTLVSEAERDTTAPEFSEVKVYAKVQSVDDFDTGAFNYNLVFSEPLADEAEVDVSNETGALLDVEYFSSEGYRVGCKWNDAVAGKVTATLRLIDLNGNAGSEAPTFRSVTLTPTESDIEAGVAFMTLASWEPAAYCSRPGALDSPLGWLPVDLPALTGSQSFLIQEFDCAPGFRLSRATGATRITFEARSIEQHDHESRVSVCIYSLGVGDDEHCSSQLVTADPDTAYSTAATLVRQPQSFSFALPEGDDDVLVTISASQALWFDSLRTEP